MTRTAERIAGRTAATTTAASRPPAEPLIDLARDLSGCAEQIATTAGRLTALLSDPELLRSLAASPRTGARVARRLAAVIAAPNALNCGTEHTRLGRIAAMLTSASGTESLPSLVAAAALKTRIRALTRAHPELGEDPQLSGIIAAVEGDRQDEAVERFGRLAAERGTSGALGALGALAPVFVELVGLFSLLDRNPFNDALGWNVATGHSPGADPGLGAPLPWVAAFEDGEGSVAVVPMPAEVAAGIDLGGTITGHLSNIALLRPYGYAIVQRVRALDGVERYVLVLPGMTRDTRPAAGARGLVGALRSAQFTESAYTRALRTVFDAAEVPEGAEIAVVGHGQGGAVGMNLVADLDLVQRYRFTHLVAAGSPIDFKVPLAPGLWIASVTNQHDIVPTLDGRGFGGACDPHPDRYEVEFTDAGHGFPACHSAERYARNLAEDVPGAAAHIDRHLAPYRGRVLSTIAFEPRDHRPEPDDGGR